jgi:hypothetical protein
MFVGPQPSRLTSIDRHMSYVEIRVIFAREKIQRTLGVK